MHIIRNVSADIETNWYGTDNLPPGEYYLSGNGSLGGGTLKLQLGHVLANGTVEACADDPDLETDASTPPVLVTITPNIKFRGVLTGSTGASGVNLWLS